MQMFAVRKCYFMIRNIFKFLVHVSHCIKMNTCGNQRDHTEHHHRQGIDVIPDGDLEISQADERVPIVKIGHLGCCRMCTL